jgi:hypothetical protein
MTISVRRPFRLKFCGFRFADDETSMHYARAAATHEKLFVR